MGYLQSTLINFLALLGWNPGTEKEFFTVEELIHSFDVTRIQPSGARFDIKRLDWLNGAHIRSLDIDELENRVADYWHPAAANFPPEFKKATLVLVRERMKRLTELSELSWFFFKDPLADSQLADVVISETKQTSSRISELVTASIETCQKSSFETAKLHDAFYELSAKMNSSPSELFKVVRIILVGGTTAPGLFETMNLLGKETVLRRLESATPLFS